jgi:hypothetical protein
LKERSDADKEFIYKGCATRPKTHARADLSFGIFSCMRPGLILEISAEYYYVLLLIIH